MLEKVQSALTKRVKTGTRVQMIRMNEDPRPIPVGMCGTVSHVDGMSQIQVKWDNGSTLAIVPEIDRYTIIG